MLDAPPTPRTHMRPAPPRPPPRVLPSARPLPLSRRPSVVAMVKTASTELAIGEFELPAFTLPVPATGATFSSAELAGKPALVMFICCHCPFVVMLKDGIRALTDEYAAKGVAVVAISSNSVETHPQDGPDAIAAEVKDKGFAFPYCFDGDAAVAKAFRAACTPDIYVFAADGKLAYHGQFDDARPGNGVDVTGADLRAALDDVLAGRPVGRPIKRSLGCNIKFAPGNEPDYFLSM